MGKLKIKIIECRNLVNMDIGSLSDPYCILKIVGNDNKVKDQQKSSIKYDNLHPEFNEKFVFPV